MSNTPKIRRRHARPAPKVPWHERWRKGIRLGETAIIIAFWLGGMTAPDMVLSGILLVLGAVASVVAICADPGRQRPFKFLLSCLLVAVFGASGIVVWWRHQADSPPSVAASLAPMSTSAQKFASPMEEAEARELQQLDDFIDRKDETSLRFMFDIPNVLTNNLLYFKAHFLMPGDEKSVDQGRADQYFFGGSRLINVNSHTLQFPDGKNKRPRFNPAPNDIEFINLSRQYGYEMEQLQSYQQTAMLPDDTRYYLGLLQKQINSNMSLMITVIHDMYLEDNRNLMRFDTPGPYQDVAANVYWSKFQDLTPIVDKIRASIQARLKVIDSERR